MTYPLEVCPSCDEVLFNPDPAVNECSNCGWPNRRDIGREET
jgi:ribosomal protein L32